VTCTSRRPRRSPAWSGGKELSPTELMEATLERIEAVNPTINAFIQLDPERGLREARAQTERLLPR